MLRKSVLIVIGILLVQSVIAQEWDFLSRVGVNNKKLLIHPTIDDNLFLITNQDFYRSTNTGISWQKLDHFYFSDSTKFIDAGFFPSDVNILWLIVDTYEDSNIHKLYISKDFGSTWRSISEISCVDVPPAFFVFHPTNEYIIYRFNQFGEDIEKSNDQGITWNSIGAGIPRDGIWSFLFAPDNPETVYISCSDGMYVSFDGGNRFLLSNTLLAKTQMLWNPWLTKSFYAYNSTGLYVIGETDVFLNALRLDINETTIKEILFVKAIPNQIFIRNQNSVYFSRDGGRTLLALEANRPPGGIVDIEIPSNRHYLLFAVNPNDGLYHLNWMNEVADESLTSPFNTTIFGDYLKLNKDITTDISIYDLNGKLVFESKGMNATDKINTCSWVAGTYFVRIPKLQSTKIVKCQ